MNFELFIAKRIVVGKKYKSSISTPIIKIAITAIALGMTIMLIAVATAAGLQSKIRNKMAGFKGHVQIVNYDANNSDVSVTPIQKKQNFYPTFNNIDGIKKVQIFANKAGILRTETDFEGIIFKGVSQNYDWTFFREYLVKGRIPSFNASRNREILISETLVNRLKINLNDTILATFIKSETSKLPSNRKYIVAGIYNTGFAQFDKNMMIGDIKEVQNLNNWSEDEIGGFEVILENFAEISIKGAQIYNEIDSTLNSKTIIEMYPSIFEWIQLFDNNVWFIIAIMILIAGINMITALLILILERTKTIGILKALGATNWSVRKIFLYSAVNLIVKGLLVGNAIALSFAFLQKQFSLISLDPATYYMNTVPINFDLTYILLLNIGTVVVCYLVLIVPSVIITKITAIKAISFE